MLGYSSSLCPRLCFTLEKSGWFTCSLFFPSAASVCVIRVSGVLLYFFLRFAALVYFPGHSKSFWTVVPVLFLSGGVVCWQVWL